MQVVRDLDKKSNAFNWAHSSLVERFIDIEEAVGSIPTGPTASLSIKLSYAVHSTASNKKPPSCGFLFEAVYFEALA